MPAYGDLNHEYSGWIASAGLHEEGRGSPRPGMHRYQSILKPNSTCLPLL